MKTVLTFAVIRNTRSGNFGKTVNIVSLDVKKFFNLFSHVVRPRFSNGIVTAGINQTKHQVNLEVIVDIDVLIPWDTASTQVKTEVLIADTVIVGKVPDTYMNVQ